MSLYNHVVATVACPACHRESERKVQGWFGLREMATYRVGDQVRWAKRDSVKSGGRPEGGHLEAEGYVVCEACHRDFFLVISIGDDVVTGVRIDESRSGYRDT